MTQINNYDLKITIFLFLNNYSKHKSDLREAELKELGMKKTIYMKYFREKETVTERERERERERGVKPGRESKSTEMLFQDSYADQCRYIRLMFSVAKP